MVTEPFTITKIAKGLNYMYRQCVKCDPMFVPIATKMLGKWAHNSISNLLKCKFWINSCWAFCESWVYVDFNLTMLTLFCYGQFCNLNWSQNLLIATLFIVNYSSCYENKRQLHKKVILQYLHSIWINCC